MSSIHYGDGKEVRDLAVKLKDNLTEIRDLSSQGDKLLKIMQGSVRDNAYDEAEEIVKEVASALLNGLDDALEVSKKLRAYGEYLDDLAR